MTTPTTDQSNRSTVSDLARFEKAILRARELHEECCHHATKAVKSAIQCGVVLRDLEPQVPHGSWYQLLAEIGLKPETARRYKAVAASFDAASQHLLEGKSLSDLYRELGLIKAAAGGGNRLGGEELNRRREQDQLTFHFDIMELAFKEVARYAEKTGHANPFQSLDRPTLDTTREQLVKALALVDEALAAN